MACIFHDKPCVFSHIPKRSEKYPANYMFFPFRYNLRTTRPQNKKGAHEMRPIFLQMFLNVILFFPNVFP